MIGSSPRKGAKVRLLVVHTTEGIRKCPDLLAFFEREYAANPNTAGSSHAGACDTCQTEFLDYAFAAWTVRSGNPVSDNLELCGLASWTRADWLTHMTMLDFCAQWLAKRSAARGIPLVKLTPAEVKAGKSGVIGHVDWTQGMSDGMHWDPGPAFPWDLVLTLATSYADLEDFLSTLTPAEQRELLDKIRAIHLESTQRIPNRVDGKTSDTVLGMAANADAHSWVVRTTLLPALSTKIDKLSVGGVTLDYDLLATKVADKLATRLSS